MWVLMADAPALVPATTAPAAWRSWMMWAIRVPPIVELRRSWLPPVRKMPVASRRAWALASSLASARVTVWMGRTWRQPSSPKTRLYSSPAAAPSDEAVLMTVRRAAGPPASSTKRLRMTRSRTLSSAPPMTIT